ncbi:hypothetical protein ABUE31_00600 [Mesorhizobium sp. ZMM04-5]|uniref:Flagellar protein n=1 Tax=Mesorhizobium marinum TaxID=3228790 RepID=A0ABV3QTU1_9HYPH
MFRRPADRIPNNTPPASLTPEQEAKRRDRRSDITVAALGVTLGLICALFPWYIFFNPEEFGVRAMRFGGAGEGEAPILLGAQPERVGAPVESQEPVPLDLDLLSTGTATKLDEETADALATDLVEQPYPPPAIAFRVVQIANGRALLEDDSGLFVVQPGSMLPDSSRIRTIEERNGKPVLVTDTGQVLKIAP